jgi:DMSO/TMAO reductase YedYZ molybdopterin-dependent catalytic subunit
MAGEAQPPAISLEELQLAARNHGMPLEALRYPLTPIGLHYLLIHFDVPAVDEATWRIEIAGRVRSPLSLSLADLRALPQVELTSTMECAGNGRARLEPRVVSQPWLSEAVGTAAWRGVALAPLLEQAGPLDDAQEVVFRGLDRGIDGDVEQDYERSLSLDEAHAAGAVLAYEMNGQSLPPQHGFPLRLVVPGWYGMTNVKWLTAITVVDEPFSGYQQAQAYRIRRDEDDEGTPITRMAPRALMVPPGIPDFFTRVRRVASGPCTLEGRAWSGAGEVDGVYVSTDGGETWSPATLDRPLSASAWRGWSFVWDATPGDYVLCCKARDEAGNEQPLEPEWNVGGYVNNAVQRVSTVVA